MAALDLKLLWQTERKQRDSNALVQNRSEFQSLHFNRGNAHSLQVNVNSP
jgi:hypothetical protein